MFFRDSPVPIEQSVKKFCGGERGEVILKSAKLKLFTAAENTITTFSFENTEKKAF